MAIDLTRSERIFKGRKTSARGSNMHVFLRLLMHIFEDRHALRDFLQIVLHVLKEASWPAYASR
jgi:hypothetical protein